MSAIGLYFGQEGYDIYKDMHHSPVNNFIHGLFMPFVVYGVLWGLPTLWCKRGRDAHNYTVAIYLLYVAYYFTFDILGAILTGAFYLPAVMAFPDYHNRRQQHGTFLLGLASVFGALCIQEFIGHWIFERNVSDISVLLTSISISPLYGARALFGIE